MSQTCFKRILMLLSYCEKIKKRLTSFCNLVNEKRPGSSGSEFKGHKTCKVHFIPPDYFSYEIKNATYCVHSCLISKHIDYYSSEPKRPCGKY